LEINQAQEVFPVDRPAGGDVVRVGHDGADIVEHCAKDLLKMFGPFLEISGIGDVKDAMRLSDQAGARFFDGGERRSGASAWRAIRCRPNFSPHGADRLFAAEYASHVS
jgi:hypothetical protein